MQDFRSFVFFKLLYKYFINQYYCRNCHLQIQKVIQLFVYLILLYFSYIYYIQLPNNIACIFYQFNQKLIDIITLPKDIQIKRNKMNKSALIKRVLIGITVPSVLAVASTFPFSIQFKCSITTNLFKFLSAYDQKYSLFLFKLLTSREWLNNNGNVDLKNKILKSGYDVEGRHLRGLQGLGLAGVQIGPATLQPNQKTNSIGIKWVKANINSYLEQYHTKQSFPQQYIASRNKRINNFKIGVSLYPDDQILQYTPYLIPQNLLNAFDSLIKSYQTPQTNQNQQINIKTNEANKYKNFQLDNRIIDFITVNTSKIKQQLGQQANKQTEAIINKFYKDATILSNPLKIALYKIEEQKYMPVYIPTTDRTQKESYNKDYQFITWKDLIQEIIKD